MTDEEIDEALNLTDYEIDEDYIDPPREPAVDADSYEVPHSNDEGPHPDFTHVYGDEDTSEAEDIDIPSPDEQVREPRTRTVFDVNEAPDPDHWQHLRRLQDDHRAPERSSQKSRAYRKRTVLTFASQLGLTDHQTERAMHVMASFDMKEMAHYPTELVVLAIVSLVTNVDDRWIRDEGQFRDLVASIDASMADVKKCRLLVKRKSSFTDEDSEPTTWESV